MIMNTKIVKAFIVCLLSLYWITGCNFLEELHQETIIITDQLDRKVEVPKQVKRVAALHHFGGKIVYALHQQHLLVERGIYGSEAVALSRIDKQFAARPTLMQGHSYNIEGLLSLNPEVIFLYASNERPEIKQFKNAGIPTCAIKGETFEESFEAVRLVSKVLNCSKRGEEYIKECQTILDLVESRLENHVSKPIKVMFSGPKSICSVATGNMLQTQNLELAGAVNVAKNVQGFWADVSPEQIANWNPDVIFIGTYLDMGNYSIDDIYKNSHVQTVKAVQDKKVYLFPSDIGWWDYPAPNCVLGVLWSAKTLYPELFSDVDMMVIANQFYKQVIGYTFEDLGGRLN